MKTDTETGLICDIYKPHDGDCSAGGISSTHRTVLLIDPSVSGPFAPHPDRPTVRLTRRNLRLRNGRGEYLHAVPDAVADKWSMMGGCFIWSSDSRFPSDYPIPLHDRVECGRESID